MAFDLVIFDCDGVIVDTETTALAVLHQMMVEKKVPMEGPEVFIEKYRGKKIASIVEAVSAYHHVDFPKNFIEKFREKSLKALEHDIAAIDGIEDVLKALDVPFCIGSNSPLKLIEACLSMTGLLHYFQGKIFSAYELQRWKPDPFLFQFAANAMGISPEKCIVVEDSPCGVQAAQAAHMFTLGYVALGTGGKIDPRAQVLEKEGAVVISDMREVLAYLP